MFNYLCFGAINLKILSLDILIIIFLSFTYFSDANQFQLWE
jgi:hypothetical protein